jgi:hypothetical protein
MAPSCGCTFSLFLKKLQFGGIFIKKGKLFFCVFVIALTLVIFSSAATVNFSTANLPSQTSSTGGLIVSTTKSTSSATTTLYYAGGPSTIEAQAKNTSPNSPFTTSTSSWVVVPKGSTTPVVLNSPGGFANGAALMYGRTQTTATGSITNGTVNFN